MTQAFTTHTGLAVPLARANVDTDVIVRMDRCAEFPRGQLGPWAFESLRFRTNGTRDESCVFNNAAFNNASILVADDNFGCGSSREWAVWALADMGLRCVIAPRFGDIFFANCFQNGLLPVRLPQSTVTQLLAEAAAGALVLQLDLPAQRITGAASGPIAFDVEPLRKSMLMQGLDEISLALTHATDTAAWQLRDCSARPWVYAPIHI
ncbi:3-isopropylmalate dehydratase small subunit [soil metagenome]